ncbi:unnamed protein product [Leptosia nina]|uniref:Uncharacterized protein n=1 Tax=Leptosia nina TaxID=320188 RepID=A0AAV1J2B8_9NEOP
MEGICRSCLTKCSNPLKYSQKNRRLFQYSTGIKVKQDDFLVFQLCRECHSNMRIACKFKKSCRNIEKQFKSYLNSKEVEESIDISAFSNFIKRHDETFKFRSPKYKHIATPNYNRNKEDDNVSTTSMRNFLNDLLPGNEIPDNVARIVSEVIREEADISDDSLESHWLQDEPSVISDLRFDFGLSPCSTTRSVINDHCYTLPLQYQNLINYDKSKTTDCMQDENYQGNYTEVTNHVPVFNIEDNVQANRCVIDKNLDKALLDESTDKIALEDLLATPPLIPNAWKPSTPTINNILFGDKLDDDITKVGTTIETYEGVKGTVDVLDEFLILKGFTREADVNHEGVKKKKSVNDVDILENNQSTINLNCPHEHDDQVEPKIIDHYDLQNKVMGDDLTDEEISTQSEETCDVTKKPSIKHMEILESDKKIVIRIKRTPQIVINDLSNNKNQGETNESCDGNKKKTAKHYVKDNVIQQITDNAKNDEEIFKKPLTPMENKYCLDTVACKLCERFFEKVHYLKVHMTKMHKLKIITPKIKSSVLRICNYCGMETRQSKSRFLKHIENHMKKINGFSCNKCKLIFSTKAKLDMHDQIHNGAIVKRPSSNEKSHVCELCGGSFSSSNYQIHLRRHNKDYGFKCAQCGSGFYRKTDLTLHMRTHTGEKPFKCTFCKKSFNRRDVLNIHIRTHTGERPFKCNICDKTFTTNVNLKTHQTRAKECLILQEKLAFPDQLREWVEIE